MARAAGTTKATPRAAAAAKSGRPPVRAVAAKGAAPSGRAAKAATVPSRSTRGAPASSRTAALPATAAPKVSKDELRAQVAKLEGTVATLRARSRELTRAAKAAAARIAELEEQLTAAQGAADAAPEKPARPARGARGATGSRRRPIDPGDAVPPGVAVAEPQPLDEEARAARDALTSHLSGE